MSSAITLDVAGVRARFESASAGLNVRVTFPRTRFVTNSEGHLDSLVRIRFGDPDPGSTPPWFVSGGTWEMHQGELGGDRVVFYTATTQGGRAPMMRVDLTPDLSIGDMVVNPRYVYEGVLEIGYPLDEYITARLLARREAVIVHASSVVDSRGAFVFIGHSGAGKSTLSSIAEQEGLKVLSDDRTVLAVRDGTVVAAGTPWHGSRKSGTPEAVPIRAIFLLEQADEDVATPMNESRALAEVMVRAVRPLADVAEQVMVLNTVEKVAHSVPAAVLRFRPTVAALAAARDFVMN